MYSPLLFQLQMFFGESHFGGGARQVSVELELHILLVLLLHLRDLHFFEQTLVVYFLVQILLTCPNLRVSLYFFLQQTLAALTDQG